MNYSHSARRRSLSWRPPQFHTYNIEIHLLNPIKSRLELRVLNQRCLKSHQTRLDLLRVRKPCLSLYFLKVFNVPRFSAHSWNLPAMPILTLSLPRVMINFNVPFQSLTRYISYSMENWTIESLLRWNWLSNHFSLHHSIIFFLDGLLGWLGEFALWARDWKG